MACMKFVLQGSECLLLAASAWLVAPCLAAETAGSHDFDFNFGVWKTHVSRLLHPLSASATRAEYDGTSVVSKIWGGRANIFELEVDGPAGHIEGAGLRLYNPQSRQWSLNWASSADGQLQPVMYGRFIEGRGEFFDQEVVDGKNVLVRNTFSDITPDSSRFEQAYSADGGRTWEENWIMTFARASGGGAAARTTAAPGHPASRRSAPGEHDFDFAFGTWQTHIRRLKDPLSGSNDWVEYDGTHSVRQVWNGRANLGELEADGQAGHLQALSTRYFNPQTHLWSVSYGTPRDGNLSRALVGQFKNGHGEFTARKPSRKGSFWCARSIRPSTSGPASSRSRTPPMAARAGKPTGSWSTGSSGVRRGR